MLHGGFHVGYVDNNQMNKAIDLFGEIKHPDEIIITVLFNACAKLRTVEALGSVRRVSREIPKPFFSNTRLVISLLDALMKCGDVPDAQSLFSRQENKVLPMYGAMMKGNDEYHLYRYIELRFLLRLHCKRSDE